MTEENSEEESFSYSAPSSFIMLFCNTSATYDTIQVSREFCHRAKTLGRMYNGTALIPNDDIGYYNRSCAEWGKNHPEANGSHQSPVNFYSNDAIYRPEMTPLITDYPPARETDVINNGKWLTLRPRYRKEIIKPDLRGILRGGTCNEEEEFELVEIRFHWGKEESRGSEHTINDKAYPMEVQFIHYNSKYESLQEAYTKTDGIVISSMFVMACRENLTLQPIVSLLEQIMYKDDSITMCAVFSPEFLLPDERLRDYWTYEGSLTHPPCTECVRWIIYRYPMTVSQEQLEEFRRLRSHSRNLPPSVPLDDGFLVDNFRTVQPLNNRTVWRSFM